MSSRHDPENPLPGCNCRECNAGPQRSDWREPGANEKGHTWTWSESRDEPGVLLFRVCAVDGIPGHDLYLKANECDIEKMRAVFDLRRCLP